MLPLVPCGATFPGTAYRIFSGSALAEIIGLDRTTLTRNLAVAEKRSLVVVKIGEDARSHIASITPSGKRALDRAFEAWRRTQAELTRQMGKGTADTLRRMSREQRDAFKEAERAA